MNNKHSKLKNLTSIISILTATFLTIIKIIAGFLTGSLAIISSMIENISDIFASIVTYIAIKYSNKPPSKTHKYGYGKAEALSALIQAAFIIGSAVLIITEAIKKLIMVEYLTATSVGVLVMITSLVVTIALVSFQAYVYNVTKSQAIKADSAHYKMDILSNIAIIISLVADYYFNVFWIDPITAIIVAIYLVYSAYDILKDAVNMLLDKELPKKTIRKIRNIIVSHNFVKGVHDIRTRDIGNGYLFEFHLELDGNISLAKAHDYAHIVEDSLLLEYPQTQIIIHQEPYGIEDKKLDDVIKANKKHKKF